MADGLSLVLLLRSQVFFVFLTVGFFLGFLVDVFLWFRVSCRFCCSVQRPGAGCGFWTSGFPTVSTALTMGWTGWKFVPAISSTDACYFCTYCFGLRPQLETKFKICKQKKEKKERYGIWVMKDLTYTPGD